MPTIRTGNPEMLRSLYDFQPTYPRALSFKTGDYFILYQTNTKHKNWWEVINKEAQMGFVPNNYVQKVNVSPSYYIQFIETCIDRLRKKEVAPEYIIEDRREVITYLKDLKRQIESASSIPQDSIGANGDTDPPLLFRNSDGQLETVKTVKSSSNATVAAAMKRSDSFEKESVRASEKQSSYESIKKSLDDIHQEILKEKSESTILSSSKVSQAITYQSVFELVESVRVNTKLSHEMSKVAVVTVIQGLHELLPASVFPYLSTILKHAQTNLVVDDVQIDQTHDASRLKIIFNELTSCKEDSQQRSWMLHEDEAVIKEYITELISILSNADVSISRHVISSDQYHAITTLIQYYQMEIRWSIRQLLLQAFGVMCSLDKTVVSIMLNSVLPGELARDMVANPRNIPKLNYSSLLLTMIFSMGEPMPVTHFDYLGISFLTFLLNNIEYPPDTDVDEQIPDLFLSLICAFNLQFDSPADNIVLTALEERDVAKTFTEKILLLLNREEDPVRIFDHEPAPPHSVLKLFLDLFSRKPTADLFYTNDVKVLIDIVVRNITDLSPGDSKRNQYLELCKRLLATTDYSDHYHRKEDLLKCFTRIFCEESEHSKADQKLVKEILTEYRDYFN